MNFFADGQELRREREKKGLSLADLAKLSGVSKGSIGNFETDVRGLGNKSKLKIWNVLQTNKPDITDGQEENCPQCADKDREITNLRQELKEARAVIRDQASALASALASKPSPAAVRACGVVDGGRETRRGA